MDARPNLSRCVIVNELPDRSCTPGSYDKTITRTQVCNGEAAGRPRKVTAAMKQRVLTAYGFDPATFQGEIDHLVSRELGGTDVVTNLWPEVGKIPNPKDAVENRLRREICTGKITLRQAQKVIATDWHHAP